MKMFFRVMALGMAIVAMAKLCFAQPDSLWSRTYGGIGNEYLISIAALAEGGYILGGVTSSSGAGDYDGWMIKTEANGDTAWCRTFGGTSADYTSKVERTREGGYFMAGYTMSSGAGNSDFWLVKTNADGSPVWNRTYGGSGEDNLYWAVQTVDSGFILAGETESFGSSNFDFWLLKVAANGDSVWSRTFGGQADAGATYVVQTADRGYIVCGVARPAVDPGGDYLLLKLNSDGSVAWSHTYGNTWDDVPWCIKQTLDGGYIVAGRSARSNGFTDVWLLKTGANGDSLWSMTFGEQSFDETGFSVYQTSDSGYVVAGQSGQTDGDFLLLRTDSRGNILWSRHWGGIAEDIGYDLQPTADGGYAIAGGTLSFGGGAADGWLVITEPDTATAVAPVSYQPFAYSLSSYPNPFNPSTTIAFELPRAGIVFLRVFDLLGREVVRLEDGMLAAGKHTTRFDGSALASGVYFARLETAAYTQTRKLVLMK